MHWKSNQNSKKEDLCGSVFLSKCLHGHVFSPFPSSGLGSLTIGLPAGLPKAMLPVLQWYFQNLMRLSSPNWFHHITPLSETQFSRHQKTWTYHSKLFSIPVQRVSPPHSGMLIPAPLPHCSSWTRDSSPSLAWIFQSFKVSQVPLSAGKSSVTTPVLPSWWSLQ